jgi:hypothetical protein
VLLTNRLRRALTGTPAQTAATVLPLWAEALLLTIAIGGCLLIGYTLRAMEG